MKKKKITLIILLTATISIGQAQVKTNQVTTKNNSQNYGSVIYQLFPTQNMWTFIKLDTRNGRMWQVQYDTKADSRFESYLNFSSLVDIYHEANGRFTLYPTENIYTFILLDQLDGRTWQVQWSIDVEKRLIIPIE